MLLYIMVTVREDIKKQYQCEFKFGQKNVNSKDKQYHLGVSSKDFNTTSDNKEKGVCGDKREICVTPSNNDMSLFVGQKNY